MAQLIVNSFITETDKNCGEERTFTQEMIKVTIALGEYRSLVADNQRLEDEVGRLNEEVNRVYAEKLKIEEQWERERQWRNNNAE